MAERPHPGEKDQEETEKPVEHRPLTEWPREAAEEEEKEKDGDDPRAPGVGVPPG